MELLNGNMPLSRVGMKQMIFFSSLGDYTGFP